MVTFDLHVERSGGPGPTVVFVHGGAVDLRLFDSVVSLLGARRSCVRYDRRGLGRSRSAAAGGSHLGDLVALLEGLGPATVVGTSATFFLSSCTPPEPACPTAKPTISPALRSTAPAIANLIRRVVHIGCST